MLVNEKLANKKLATPFGHVTFNTKGETNELNKTQQQELGKLPGFKYVEDKPAAAKKAPEKKAAPAAKKKPTASKKKADEGK